MPDLLAALRARRSWSGAVPTDTRALVSVRATTTDDVLRVHPLGQLEVRQRVVPLDTPLARFGNLTLAGEQRFRITAVQVTGVTSPSTQVVTDYFAPGQFLDLTDAERLSRPSFERLPAGPAIVSDTVVYGGQHDATLMALADAPFETLRIAADGRIDRSTAGGSPAPATNDITGAT